MSKFHWQRRNLIAAAVMMAISALLCLIAALRDSGPAAFGAIVIFFAGIYIGAPISHHDWWS